MSAESLVARLFARFPSLGALVGLAMLLGFGALALSSGREYLAFPKQPQATTVAQASARVTSAPWVSLTDARWLCDRALDSPGTSKNYYVPATDPEDKILVLLSFDSPIVCEAAARQPVSGVLEPLNDRLRHTLLDGGFSFSGLPGGTVLVLSTFAGPENSATLLLICLPMMALGVLVMWFYRRKSQEAPVPRPAAAAPIAAPAATERDAAVLAAGDVSAAVRAWHMRGPVLPPRPYSLRPEMVRRSWLIVTLATPIGLALWGLLLFWQGNEVRRYLTERRIFRTGAAAQSVKVAGKTSGKLFLTTADLDVVYEDARGQTHNAKQSISYVMADIDQKQPLELRHDPQDPSRFALSWALDLGVWRMLNVALYVVIFGLIASLPLLIAGGRLRMLRSARRAATDSEEVVLRVVSTVEQMINGAPSGNVELHFIIAGQPEPEKPRSVLRRKGAPPLLMLDEQHLIGLRCRPLPGTTPSTADNDVVLVEHDLHPYVFTATEVAAISARLTALSGAAARGTRSA